MRQRRFRLWFSLVSMAGIAGTQAADLYDGALQEVIVTARKRDESVQSVPSTVSVLSSTELDRRGVSDLRDLAGAIPGVNMDNFESDKASISIRGVSTTTFSPTVGFFVDDVTVGYENTGTLGGGQVEPPLFDVQRVEVLKGPQGTLYGGSSMGGAIKFVSNQPDLVNYQVKGSLDGSNTQGGAASGAGSAVVNLPLIPGKVALRVGAAYDHEGGWVDRVPGAEGFSIGFGYPGGKFISANTVTRDNTNYANTFAGRVALEFAPMDDLTAQLETYFRERKSPDLSRFWPNLPRFEQSNRIGQPVDDRVVLPILTVHKRWGALDLASITGYGDRKRNETQDYSFFTGALAPPLAQFVTSSNLVSPTQNFSQEVRLSSNEPGSKLNFVSGAYFQRESFAFNQNVFTQDSGIQSPGLPLDQVYLGRTRTITRQSALFGELTYSLTPKLDVTAGGRWFRINTELTRRADGLFNGGLSNDFSRGSETGFSPKGSVSYKLTEHDLVYLSANKGFRPGGGNGFVPTSNCAFDLASLGLSNAPSTYKSDSLWNYEIGSKNSFLDGQMVVNASGYYIDWKNIQQSVSLPNCGFAFIGNVGAAKVKGAEVELKFAVIRGLTLATSATYADAYLTQSAPGTQGQPGDPILSSPKLVVTASTDYRLSVASERVGFVHLDYQWHGSQTQSFNRYITVDADPTTGQPFGESRTVNDPSYLQPHYDIANASLGLEAPRWTVRAYVSNVFDKHPLLSLYNSGGYETVANTLRPRTVGLALAFTF